MVNISIIENIANLAKIEMDGGQKEKAAKSLSEILVYVDDLSKADTDGVKSTEYIKTSRDVFRDDVPGVEFSQEEALKNAPLAKKGHFAIPKVIG